VRIPGLSGPELQSRLNALGSSLPIIFLTDYPDHGENHKGRCGGLPEPVSSDLLLRAVERAIVRHKEAYRVKRALDLVRARIETLTPRERQVFERVVRGDTNKHAANALGSTERTIKAHRQWVMEKLQVQTLGRAYFPCRARRRYRVVDRALI
jgi:FixJ family two-component response regulator